MLIRLLLLLFILVSCGAEETATGTPKGDEGPYTPSAPITFTGDFEAFEGMEFSFDPTSKFSEDVSSGYTFSHKNAPGFLSIDEATGELTGEPEVSGLFEEIEIIATNNSDSSVQSKKISIAVNGDPLRPYAWHLKNTGQKNFAIASGSAGYDINVYDVFKNEIFGEGIRIAISDSGAEINHDDLYQNMLSGEHRDYSLHSPYVGDPVPTNAHGTAVAGIVNARGWNNHGSIGVAPKAKTAVFQFLDSTQATSVLISQASGDFNIFNFSYGDVLYEDTQSDQDYLDHVKDQTLNQQKVFVKAAGNEFLLADGNTCAPHNANMPYENESPYLIVVGAVNASGGKTTYSNAGSNLWVVAPGGEYGISYPAIMSTDLPTCFKGFSKATGDPYNDFEYKHPLNTKCHYTSTMNGTSSATPVVTGVIALMLEANPNLTQRDIKHILASTSERIDPDHDDNYFGKVHPSEILGGCSSLSLDNYEYEQGWVQNRAGYWFNNFYGFGLVDAKAAVDAASSYVSNLGDLQELNRDFDVSSLKSAPGSSIPDHNKDGVTDTINVTNNLTVESVQIKVNISHNSPGEIGIELLGPETASNRTKSILLNINNSLLLGDDKNLNVVLASHAFYGESAVGDWTIRVIDGKSGTTGTLNSWSINIIGH